jgi:alpha-beta hydrolase superfamily lysophospholipase
MQAYEVETDDGLNLTVQKWNEVNSPARTLIIIHGLGEHQDRYQHVAEHFVKDGFQVYSYDQRGHGKSEGMRGHSPGITSNIRDLELVIESIAHENLFIYGHSFGGNVLANFLIRKDCASLRATVLTGSWLRLFKEPSKFDVTLASIMNKIYPKFSQNNQLDPKTLSNIEKVAEDYVNDPLVHDQITAGLFKSFHASGLYAIEHASNISTPTLVIHGANELITDPNGSKEFAEKAGELATICIYDKTKHELHNDNVSSKMLSEISDWLSKINSKE